METKKKKKGLVWIIIAALVVVGVVLYLIFGTGNKHLQLSAQPAAEGTVEMTVMATGTVQPVEKVDIGTQVSGIIEKIYVDFNSVVEKNQLLAELDKQTLRERVSQSEASVASAKADLAYAQSNYNRTKELFDVKAATQVSLEEAENSYQRARTSLINAEADLSQTRVNLGYADIRSPMDGVVLNRAVEEGQTVASSFNTPTLFTVARDLTKMQVEAAVDEADIGRVKEGQSVTFTVDAFPTDNFTGTVQQVRIEPVITSNVVTYTVIIEAPNPDFKLFPGMTANIDIVTESRTGTTIPVEALYFTMDADVARNLGVRQRDAGSAVRGNQAWVKSGNEWVLRDLKTGLQDGVKIIVEEGVNPGDSVILSAAMVKEESQRNGASNPLMPRGPRRR